MSEQLKSLLNRVEEGKLKASEAYDQLKNFEDLGFVKIDHHRAKRKGFPEVIFGEKKTAEQITSIFNSLIKTNEVVLATRVSIGKAKVIKESLPNLEFYFKG